LKGVKVGRLDGDEVGGLVAFVAFVWLDGDEVQMIVGTLLGNFDRCDNGVALGSDVELLDTLASTKRHDLFVNKHIYTATVVTLYNDPIKLFPFVRMFSEKHINKEVLNSKYIFLTFRN
jgi:hypothetical protein